MDEIANTAWEEIEKRNDVIKLRFQNSANIKDAFDNIYAVTWSHNSYELRCTHVTNKEINIQQLKIFDTAIYNLLLVNYGDHKAYQILFQLNTSPDKLNFIVLKGPDIHARELKIIIK